MKENKENPQHVELLKIAVSLLIGRNESGRPVRPDPVQGVSLLGDLAAEGSRRALAEILSFRAVVGRRLYDANIFDAKLAGGDEVIFQLKTRCCDKILT